MKDKVQSFSLIILSVLFLIFTIYYNFVGFRKLSIILIPFVILNFISLYRRKPSLLSLLFYGIQFSFILLQILLVVLQLILSAFRDSVVTYYMFGLMYSLALMLVLILSTGYVFYVEIKWFVRYRKNNT